MPFYRIMKPMRYWHKTGKKHLQHLIQCRIKAAGHPMSQRNKKDFLMLVGFGVFSEIGVLYSLGVFSPQGDFTVVPRKQISLKKEPKKGLQPIPCEDDPGSPPSQPCPATDNEPLEKEELPPAHCRIPCRATDSKSQK